MEISEQNLYPALILGLQRLIRMSWLNLASEKGERMTNLHVPKIRAGCSIL